MGLQSFNERAKGRLRERADAVLAAGGYQENIRVGTRAESGLSRWWRMVPYVGGLLTIFKKYYYIGVTDRSLVVLGASLWTARPVSVQSVTPLGQAAITDFDHGAIWGSFRLTTPSRPEPLTLHFSSSVFGNDAEFIANTVYQAAAYGQQPQVGYGQPSAGPYQQ